MPATTITINREQRDGLYELVRNHLGSVGDLWVALEQTKDFAKAEQLGHELAEDFRLMADIGWAEDEGRERFELTMPPHDLMEALQRLHGEAGVVLAGSEASSDEDAATNERFRRGYEACERALAELDPRAGDRA